MSVYHFHAEAFGPDFRCTTPPEPGSPESAAQPELTANGQQGEATPLSGAAQMDLETVRAAIQRLKGPYGQPDPLSVRRGIIRLLMDESVLDDDEREVA